MGEISGKDNGVISPTRLLLVIVVSVVVAELLTRLVHRGGFPVVDLLLDSLLLALVILLVVYLLIYRPLYRGLERQRQLKAQSDRSYEMLATVLDSLDAVVYVAEMESREILLLNKYGRDIYGDVVGKTCVESFNDVPTTDCPFCANNQKLLDEHGEPAGMIRWEHQNPVNKRWYVYRNRAIRWIDGRLVRLEIATDFTARKFAEDEREALIGKLEQALAEVKTLSGLMPICSHCKKIRDDQGYWNDLERYIGSRSEAEFTHSICPSCLQEHFPEQAEQVLSRIATDTAQKS